MPIRYTVDASTAIEELKTLQGKLQHLAPAWLNVTRIARQAFARNFSVAGIPPWAPLAPSTVRQKLLLNLPGGLRTPKGRVPPRLLQNGTLSERTILIRTGTLRDSLARRGARGNVTTFDDNGAFAGTAIPYAIFHELGVSTAKVHIPRRVMTTLTNDDIIKIQNVITTYLLGDNVTIIDSDQDLTEGIEDEV